MSSAPETNNRSDAQWKSFIDAQTEQILSSLPDTLTPSTQFSSITSSSDPLLPLSVDHTLLKPEATPEQIDNLCDEAINIYAKRVTERLKGSKVITCCVVGFPLGAVSAQAIASEAQLAIQDGASEIDMVLPVGLLLSSTPPYADIYRHLRTVIQASAPVSVKVIIETGLLKSQEKKIAACLLAAEAGAAFVKTCTGFSGGQATEEDVRLMWQAVRRYNAVKEGKVKVKASGGVRTLESCLAMLRAGAERIGTSSGVALVTAQQPASSGSY
ncbi:hypothetical protein NMY22_g1389 [Coprinellus aureogranulatus]|nr:hypothetical protein NMY22_g1389 [Coprinellus aureogranulatus]